MMRRLRDAAHRGIVVPFQQLNARKLILAATAGILGGIFPVPMFTSIVTLIFCRMLHCCALQIALATAINFLVTPLEVLLIVPFACATATVLGSDASRFTVASLYNSMNLGLIDFFFTSSSLLIHSFLSWCFFAIPLLYIVRSLLYNEIVGKHI
ncbi:uncharacterized protein TM35_000212780 [Trypanosoma theileri]|uniref:DUF2062 domain-containing protein n=1 Tax=Trypanosoma theileri TaxID=67003 RepID=A0A1X0NSJ4_9TRYP|nr:uncharacterized protein TM35_000212780 [Trypanosoma theileri]ORC87672.1 hypothetical protein TM35_000212780 [Trypanosoma theileri]